MQILGLPTLMYSQRSMFCVTQDFVWRFSLTATKSNKKQKNKKGSDRDELDINAPVKAKKGKRGHPDEVEEEEYDEYQYLTKKR